MARLHVKLIAGCCFAFLTLCTSCASKLPKHEWTTPEAALQIMNENASRVRTLAADCVIQLDSTYEQTIILDGVLYSQEPDQLRIAGWKFSDRVFDLLVTNGQSWFYAAALMDGMPEGGDDMDQVGVDGFAAMWRYASGVVDQDRILAITDLEGDRFEITLDTESNGASNSINPGEGARVVYLVEKSTLTVREISFLVSKQLMYRVSLGRYRVFGDIVWPTQLSGRGEQGSFDVQMNELELNRPLPKTTFEPSPRMRMQSE